MSQSATAKFTTGSTMRHVVVMTLTGSLGLSFMFLVDFLALFWISQLGREDLIAALGFAATVQFFLISISVGMMIAAVALVSRALGQGNPDRARRIATSSMIYAVAMQGGIAVTVFVLRGHILAWSGAEGEVLDVAAQFLGISVMSLPLIALGMSAAAVLRAAGEAWRAMMVTTTGGLVALVVDPVLIIWLELGVPGAAMAIVISRLVMACAGLYWVAGKGLLAPPAPGDLRDTMAPFLGIALPAVATQVSTPFGNWVLIRAMAEHGDSAVAGLGVAARLQILGFGGIFALSGAIGGIIGQNHGAGLPGRVRQSYVDALKFCAIYTAIVWALMVALADPLARAFGLTGQAAEVLHWFAHVGAGSFMFTGALFVANAAFNNLGRPIWATVANWTRDGAMMAPLAFGLGAVYAAPGVIAGQAVANILAGTLAAWVGWRFVSGRLDRTARPA
ncbi:MATE family efflux transporter [Lutimaribacter sp. EGI FJ00015]|uniref:MATE family efflux transporter n=1 Tax=Lutimaribacter degradans TaxID=2945989 RepID=A0ACC5ZR34_9RHOB|nr:MATE family efflux transporter [Lutimaribacter sp. EGI FJ00013]MCM2560580.1 MATE family efflux transporter [Lutimaribacter sp. EGI FJ00013]MCO0612477.1 MATE family efflux transporter [Lutimaribacter sp. EGI FJ00015]MCO0634404.1 MATE family efflux transporter [Lutimaribacter sp. EGI FJ00014]